jgi:hypothetical protein
MAVQRLHIHRAIAHCACRTELCACRSGGIVPEEGSATPTTEDDNASDCDGKRLYRGISNRNPIAGHNRYIALGFAVLLQSSNDAGWTRIPQIEDNTAEIELAYAEIESLTLKRSSTLKGIECGELFRHEKKVAAISLMSLHSVAPFMYSASICALSGMMCFA